MCVMAVRCSTFNSLELNLLRQRRGFSIVVKDFTSLMFRFWPLLFTWLLDSELELSSHACSAPHAKDFKRIDVFPLLDFSKVGCCCCSLLFVSP
jgi:hypothetical protein